MPFNAAVPEEESKSPEDRVEQKAERLQEQPDTAEASSALSVCTSDDVHEARLNAPSPSDSILLYDDPAPEEEPEDVESGIEHETAWKQNHLPIAVRDRLWDENVMDDLDYGVLDGPVTGHLHEEIETPEHQLAVTQRQRADSILGELEDAGGGY